MAGALRTLAPPRASVALGGAGVAYALLRAARASKDPRLLDVASDWAAQARASLRRRGALVGGGVTQAAPGSLFLGVAGVGFVSALLAHERGETTARERALRAVLAATRVSSTASVELYGGVAGAIVGLALLHRATRDRRLLRRADQLAALLIGVATGRAQVAGDGMAHGLAGVHLGLLRWATLCGRTLPRDVIASLERLAAMKRAQPRRPGRSWCSGPAGLALLWAAAHEATGDDRFRTAAHDAAREACERAAPFPGLCCGCAGDAYAVLAAARIGVFTRSFARQHAAALAVRSLEAGVAAPWPDALWQGSAGLFCLALDLEHEAPAFPILED